MTVIRQGRWWALGGSLTLVAIVTGTLALRSADPACAVQAAAAAATKGKATFYDGEGGNCSYPSAPADRMYVALSPSEYDAGAPCGGYLDVTGPKGKVRVKVTDQCPPCTPGHIDLSREAFAKIANPVDGVVPVTYTEVVSPSTPALTFRIKEGASQYWFAVLVDNTGNALRSVEAKGPGGSFRAAARAEYNYWIVESGLGAGPYSIRVTDVRGRSATATGITMSPGKTQTARVRMNGAAAVPEKATTPPPSKKPTPSPKPTRPPATSAPPTSVGTAAVAAPLDVAVGLGTRCT